jgi:hypothetical protein
MVSGDGDGGDHRSWRPTMNYYDTDFTQPLPPKRPFDYSAYLSPNGVAEILWDDPNIRAAWRAGVETGLEMGRELTPEQKAEADAIADQIAAGLANTPPTRDDDDPGFGDIDIEREECVDPDCPCWQDGFDSGYDAALEDLGIEPDDGDVT